MSFLAKVLLYPVVVPVLMCYEYTKLIWTKVSQSTRHFSLLAVWAYFFGPVISVLGGLELVSYLGWTLGVRWSIWMLSFVLSQVAFMGVFWPTFVFLTLPILYLVHHGSIFAFRLVQTIDRYVWKISSWIGMAIPLFSYWRNANGLKRDHVGSTPFLLLLFAFTLVSAVIHSFQWMIPYWNFLSSALGTMAPWLTIISHVVLVLFAFLAFLVLVGAFACRPMISNAAPALYGPPSIMIAAHVYRFTRIGDLEVIPLIGSIIGVYLVSFTLVLPILGLLSLRRRLLDLFRTVFRQLGHYHRWASTQWNAPQVSSFTSLLCSILITMTCYLIGTHFSIHPALYIIHIIVIVVLFLPNPDPFKNLVALSVFWVALAICFLLPYLPYAPIFPYFFLIGFAIAIGPINFFIVFPILAPLLLLLSGFAQASGILTAFSRLRTKAGQLISGIGRRWESLLSASFDDHSSFNAMFGWILISLFLVIFLVQYSSMLFLSGTGPISALSAQSLSDWIPSAKSRFEYVGIRRDAFGFVVSHNQTAKDTIEVSIQNSTASASSSASIAESPALIAWYILDILVFSALGINVLIFFGKGTSKCSALVLAFETCVTSFSVLRKLQLFLCNYPIITELMATEFSVLVAFTIPSLIYLTVKKILGPYLPRLAPLICIPFERLWSLQQWLFRLALRQWIAFAAFVLGTWDSLFGRPPPPRNTQPKYVRPRRYG